MFEDYTCRIQKDGKDVFVSKKDGIAPLLQVIDQGIDCTDCIAYDKIVGKAAGLLYVLLRVKEVHAQVMSEPALLVLQANGVVCTHQTLAQNIINRKGTGLCPMEQAVQNASTPEQALVAIRNKLTELRG